MTRRPPRAPLTYPLFPYTTRFRSGRRFRQSRRRFLQRPFRRGRLQALPRRGGGLMAGTDSTKAQAADPSPAVVLVEPQMGENIGFAARAMLNCGQIGRAHV